MSRRTYISKWDPKQSMQMSYVRRMGDQGGRNTSARGCGKGRGQVSTFQAATAGIPRNRRDAGDGEDEEPYRDNEEADDPQQVRWYGTHASSNAKAMFGGAEVGASTNRRIQDDENDQSRDVAAPSVRRYAAPVRTVQRVGLFGNAKQSECIQNLDQVYPNLQKRVQRQLNEIAAPEDDVEWARGKVPQMQVGNREMEHGKERRRMHDDMNEADMGRGQGMFDQPPSRRALLSPNAGFQQNDDVNFALQPQTLAAHDNRRKRAKSQGARQRADRYEAIRQRVAYPTRLIAEDDEEEEAKIYDRSPPSSSYREPEDGQRKTTSMFASPHMQLPVITDRILQALPPVYLRDDTVESYDSAVIGILAENMRVNKIRNQLLTNAMKMSEHDKAQDKAIRKKQATAMSSFLDKTQCLRSDDLEDDSDDEDEDDRNPSTQPSKERRIFANTHENLFDSDERLFKECVLRERDQEVLEDLGINIHSLSPLNTPLLEHLFNETISMRNMDALINNQTPSEINTSPTFLRNMVTPTNRTGESSDGVGFSFFNKSAPTPVDQLLQEQSQQFMSFDTQQFNANFDNQEEFENQMEEKEDEGKYSSGDDEPDPQFRAIREQLFPKV